MRTGYFLILVVVSLTLRAAVGSSAADATFDAAPFALPLPEGSGLLWEDPREIHSVLVEFVGAAPPPDQVRLEYWGSRWPQQHLPKDREPGGGNRPDATSKRKVCPFVNPPG